MKSFLRTRLVYGLVLSVGLMNSIDLIGNAFEFESKNAMLSLQNESNLIIHNPLIGFDGTLFSSTDARIQGQNISFNNGCLKFPDKKSNLLGTYDPNEDRFLLFDNETFIGSGISWQPITVYGGNARIQGQPTFYSDITLNDSNAWAILDIQSTLNCNVVLNGGMVQLGSDLCFADNMNFLNDGIINLYNKCVVFGGAPLEWYYNTYWNTAGSIILHNKVTVYATQTLSGSIAVNGNGNVIDLSHGGILLIPSNSYVYLSDVVIKGLGQSAGSIQFADDSSVLHLSNVTLELIDDFATNSGLININGPCSVITQDKSWSIGGSCHMIINGVAFSKDAVGASQPGTLQFADIATQLELVESGTITSIGCCQQVTALVDQVHWLEEEIETLVTLSQFEVCCTTMQHQIDALNTSTTFLQLEIDQLQTDTHCGHIIVVESAVTFDAQELLQENTRVTFEFVPCQYAQQPILTFAQNTQVLVPHNCQLSFKGEGVVNLQDGVQFNFMGTDTQSRGYLHISDRAALTLERGATCGISGVGELQLSDWGMIFLNDSCLLNIGTQQDDHIEMNLARFGNIKLEDDAAHLCVKVGGCYINTDKYGLINVQKGTVNFKSVNLQLGVDYLTYLLTRNNYLFQTNNGQVVICDSAENTCVYYGIDGSTENTIQSMPVLLPVKVDR